MRVLFVLRHEGYRRNFEWLLRELENRGHETAVVFEPRVGRSAARLSRRTLRYWLDYVPYLAPEYDRAPRLRRRAEELVAAPVRPLLRLGPVRRLVARLERALPPDRAVDRAVLAQAPDVVVVSPLVSFGSPQTEYVRAARRQGIPSVLCVASWDNLTSKARIRELPDSIVVWNEAQAREAGELHGADAERVVVAGAYPYDHWLGWAPSLDRGGHCRRVGLDPERPYVLYVCSSGFIAPEEVTFVLRWIEAIRGSRLGEVGVLVRPHPQYADAWRDVDLGPLGNASVWPREDLDPVDERRRAEYFDSIHHGAAVVGVNTTALVEAAVLGRPTLTLLDPAVSEGQVGTLHFELLAGDRGALRVATGMEEHLAQLEAALVSGDDDAPRRFAAWFARPHGLDRAAAPYAADAIERAARPDPESRNAAELGSGRSGLRRWMRHRARRAIRLLRPSSLRKRGLGARKRLARFEPSRIRKRVHHHRRRMRKAVLRGRWETRRTWAALRYRRTYSYTLENLVTREELGALLNARALLGRGAEVGVKRGAFSERLLASWRGECLVSIDPWREAATDDYRDNANVTQEEHEEFLRQTRARLARFGPRSEIWRMTSLDAAARTPRGSLDFVFIDARHDYPSVKADLEAWYGAVRPGGIVCGHDYVDGDLPNGLFGVKRAVDEFFDARGLRVHVGRPDDPMFPSWFVEVPWVPS